MTAEKMHLMSQRRETWWRGESPVGLVAEGLAVGAAMTGVSPSSSSARLTASENFGKEVGSGAVHWQSHLSFMMARDLKVRTT